MKLSEYLKDKDREEFAKIVNRSKGYIDNLCSNSHYYPSRKLARRIEEVTGGDVTAVELLFREAPKRTAA